MLRIRWPFDWLSPVLRRWWVGIHVEEKAVRRRRGLWRWSLGKMPWESWAHWRCKLLWWGTVDTGSDGSGLVDEWRVGLSAPLRVKLWVESSSSLRAVVTRALRSRRGTIGIAIHVEQGRLKGSGSWGMVGRVAGGWRLWLLQAQALNQLLQVHILCWSAGGKWAGLS